MTLEEFKAGLANGLIDNGRYLSSDDQRGQSPFWQYGPGGANPVDPGIISQYQKEQAAAVPGFDQATLQGYQSNLGSDSANGYKSFTQGLTAVNPKTGQQERVYSVNTPGEDGSPNTGSSRYFFESDPNRPQNAQATMAGGYSSGNDKNSIVQPAIMGGLAAIGGGAALGAFGGGSAAAGGTAPVGAGIGSAAAGGGELAGGTGLTAGAGTADVMGTGGTLTGGAFSSAGGSGLTAGAAGGTGLSVTPAMSSAAGFGGMTGAAAGTTAAGSSSLLDWLGSSGVAKGIATVGGNALINGALFNRAQHQASDLQNAQNPLNDPRRAPFQNAATDLANNPQDYMANNPFAQSLGNYYRNSVIPAQFARSGNAGEVIDRNGSQFANAIAGNYNQLFGQLSAAGGFQSSPGVSGVAGLDTAANNFLSEGARGFGDAAERIFGNIAKPGSSGNGAGTGMSDFPTNPLTNSSTQFA